MTFTTLASVATSTAVPIGILIDGTLADGSVLAAARDGLNDHVAPMVADAVAALAPLAALALAAVFTVAAATKLAHPPTARREFTALGLPAPGLLVRVVPPVEALVAVLLLVRPAAGGLAAAATLTAFTAVLAAAVRSGRSVSCGCLGSLSRRPVSTATLFRNLALIATAAVAATTPVPTGLTPTMPAGEVVLAVGPALLLIAIGAQALALRSQIGRIWSVELAGEQPPRRGRRLDAPQPVA